MKRRPFIAVVAVLLFLVCGFAPSMLGQAAPLVRSTLELRIDDFQLIDDSFSNGVALLSLTKLPLSIGFEDVLKERFADPPVAGPSITLVLKNATVREILDGLCARDNRYTWSLD